MRDFEWKRLVEQRYSALVNAMKDAIKTAYGLGNGSISVVLNSDGTISMFQTRIDIKYEDLASGKSLPIYTAQGWTNESELSDVVDDEYSDEYEEYVSEHGDVDKVYWIKNIRPDLYYEWLGQFLEETVDDADEYLRKYLDHIIKILGGEYNGNSGN